MRGVHRSGRGPGPAAPGERGLRGGPGELFVRVPSPSPQTPLPTPLNDLANKYKALGGRARDLRSLPSPQSPPPNPHMGTGKAGPAAPTFRLILTLMGVGVWGRGRGPLPPGPLPQITSSNLKLSGDGDAAAHAEGLGGYPQARRRLSPFIFAFIDGPDHPPDHLRVEI